MKQPTKLVLSILVVMILLLPPLQSALTSPAAQTIPTISILSVVRDQSVTIRTSNFPANQTFTARMGAIGTRGVNGTVVGTTASGSGGAFDVTYVIPAALRGSAQIAIRLESPAGYYAYNWFYNSSSGAVTTPAATSVPVTGYTGIPTFSIESVVRDTSVTIVTNNFPANQTFTARMGAIGTRGVNGTVVGTTASGTGGVLRATYEIPSALRGTNQIAIRLESPQGYFAYNWFYNSTIGAAPTPSGPTPTPGGPTPTPRPTPVPGYTGIPTISVTSVVRDTSVTIRTNNFPANQTFTARMGAMGTRGVDGIVVGTTASGTGGALTVTYDIPASLRGSSQIAIRLESASGYYAYNWFYNSTYP